MKSQDEVTKQGSRLCSLGIKYGQLLERDLQPTALFQGAHGKLQPFCAYQVGDPLLVHRFQSGPPSPSEACVPGTCRRGYFWSWQCNFFAATELHTELPLSFTLQLGPHGIQVRLVLPWPGCNGSSTTQPAAVPNFSLAAGSTSPNLCAEPPKAWRNSPLKTFFVCLDVLMPS